VRKAFGKVGRGSAYMANGTADIAKGRHSNRNSVAKENEAEGEEEEEKDGGGDDPGLEL
jgi:hypothetical protein